MKNVYQIIFILLISTVRLIYSQVDPLLEQLDNPAVWVRSSALNQIIDKNLVQYAEELEQRIFNQPEPYMIDLYLWALREFKSPNLYSITQNFIEVADSFMIMNPPKDPMESKVLATEILFSFGDYSTANYVFEILERDRPKINGLALALLKDIILYVPIYEQQAKSELLNIVNNIPTSCTGLEDYDRYVAINTLSQIYGSEVQGNVVDLFSNDPFMSVRSKCLKILFDFNYENLNQLLIERLIADIDWPLRIEIADSLLKHFGKPSDLKSVIDYQPTEPNEIAKSSIGYSIQDFIPPRPTVTTGEMIENLIAYNNELYQYGWITDSSNYLVYKGYLEAIQSSYAAQSLVDICANLNSLLTLVESQHGGPLLTGEGYKFLYYHGTYIKEKIESELGSCKKGKK